MRAGEHGLQSAETDLVNAMNLSSSILATWSLVRHQNVCCVTFLKAAQPIRKLS